MLSKNLIFSKKYFKFSIPKKEIIKIADVKKPIKKDAYILLKFIGFVKSIVSRKTEFKAKI